MDVCSTVLMTEKYQWPGELGYFEGWPSEVVDLGWSAIFTVFNMTESVRRGSVVKQSKVGLRECRKLVRFCS